MTLSFRLFRLVLVQFQSIFFEVFLRIFEEEAMKIGVVGNEASDADSIVSAIIYAWFLNHTDKTGNEYIAFVQCEIDDLSQRLDFNEICKIAKPPKFDCLKSVHDNSVFVSHWILLDHHFPSRFLRNRTDFTSVVEIVDHHVIGSQEEEQFVATVSKVDIRTIGSTCTIIAERILSENSNIILPEWVIWMLFLVIMNDSHNLNVSRGKTTEKDVEIYNSLKSMLRIEDAEPLFHQLTDSIFSPDFWYKAPLERLLNYDFKEMEGVGYSVLLRSIDGLKDEEMINFAKAKKFKILVVSSGFLRSNGTLRRQQLLYLPVDSLKAEKIIAAVLAQVKMEITKPFSEEKIVRFEIFDDSFSRKKFFPSLLAILRENAII